VASTASAASIVAAPPDGSLTFPPEVGLRENSSEEEAQYQWSAGNYPWVVYQTDLGPSSPGQDLNADAGDEQQKQTSVIWLVLFVSLLFGLAIGVIPILVKRRAARRAAAEEVIAARRRAFKKSAHHGRPLPLVPLPPEPPPRPSQASSSYHLQNRTPQHYNNHQQENRYKSTSNVIKACNGGLPGTYFTMYQPLSAPPPRFITPSPNGGYSAGKDFSKFTHNLSSEGGGSDENYEYDNIDGDVESAFTGYTRGTDSAGYVLAGSSNVNSAMLGSTNFPTRGSMLDAAASTDGSSPPSYYSRVNKGVRAINVDVAVEANDPKLAVSGNNVQINTVKNIQVARGSALSQRASSADSMPLPMLPKRSKAPVLPIAAIPEELSLAALARSPDLGRFRALYSFAGSGYAREMPFEVGALLFVHDQSHPDWWAATVWPTGQFGFVPSSFIVREESGGYTFQEPIALESRLETPSNSVGYYKASPGAFGGYGNAVLDWDADDTLTRMSPDVVARLTPDVAFKASDEETADKTEEESNYGVHILSPVGETMFHTSRPGSLLSNQKRARPQLLAKRISSNI